MKTMLLIGAIGAAPGSSPAATRLLCSATYRLASTTWAAAQIEITCRVMNSVMALIRELFITVLYVHNLDGEFKPVGHTGRQRQSLRHPWSLDSILTLMIELQWREATAV